MMNTKKRYICVDGHSLGYHVFIFLYLKVILFYFIFLFNLFHVFIIFFLFRFVGIVLKIFLNSFVTSGRFKNPTRNYLKFSWRNIKI